MNACESIVTLDFTPARFPATGREERGEYTGEVTTDRIAWIDCEMTGLEVGTDELVEVACLMTDYDLNILDEGVDVIIKPSAAALDHMGEFVTKMHTTSGLITELDSGETVEHAQSVVLDYIRSHAPVSGKAPLGGNSVGTDKMFLQAQMPALVDHLHYRIIDVSSIKELAKRWYPKAYYQSPEKTGGHRALGDIKDSIAELVYYRSAVFVEEPLDTDALKARAEAARAKVFGTSED